jgi:hypothetical protein
MKGKHPIQMRTCHLATLLTIVSTINLPLQDLRTSSRSQGFATSKRDSWKFDLLPRPNDAEKGNRAWLRALRGAASLAGLVLILNTIWVIIIISLASNELGLWVIYEGSCSKASTIDTSLHVIINILSTALLGASNYTIQCLNAPAREDIDRAHQAGTSLSIGVTNLRNLKWIPWHRTVLLVVLFITAWPLHVV